MQPQGRPPRLGLGLGSGSQSASQVSSPGASAAARSDTGQGQGAAAAMSRDLRPAVRGSESGSRLPQREEMSNWRVSSESQLQ